MNQNDGSTKYMDPSGISPWPVAMRYGLIWGLVGILISLVSNLMGWDNPVEPNIVMSIVLSLVSLGVTVGFLVTAIKKHRDQNLGGFITLGQGFKVGFFTTLIYGLIASVFTFILLSFINPDMLAGVQELQIEQLEESGLSDEEIEQSMFFVNLFTGPTGMTILTFIGSLIWGAILSLIIGAVMKKDPPPAV